MEVEKINIIIKRRQDIEFLTKIQMQEELKDRKELRRYNGKVSGSRDFLIDALWTCVQDEIKEEISGSKIHCYSMAMSIDSVCDIVFLVA